MNKSNAKKQTGENNIDARQRVWMARYNKSIMGAYVCAVMTMLGGSVWLSSSVSSEPSDALQKISAGVTLASGGVGAACAMNALRSLSRFNNLENMRRRNTDQKTK